MSLITEMQMRLVRWENVKRNGFSKRLLNVLWLWLRETDEGGSKFQ